MVSKDSNESARSGHGVPHCSYALPAIRRPGLRPAGRDVATYIDTSSHATLALLGRVAAVVERGSDRVIRQAN